MKKILILSLLAFVSLNASSLKIEDLRTELYSKTGQNSLKKVALSLEFEGEGLENNQNKLLDATNTIISSFFYEDLFTEIGKLRFKETLTMFLNKKYKLKIGNIYILSLKGVERFDLQELKDFIAQNEPSKQSEANSQIQKAENNNTQINVPEVPKVPDINTILQSETTSDEGEEKTADDINLQDLRIDTKSLELPQPLKAAEQNATPLQFKDSNSSQGFFVEVDENNETNSSH